MAPCSYSNSKQQPDMALESCICVAASPAFPTEDVAVAITPSDMGTGQQPGLELEREPVVCAASPGIPTESASAPVASPSIPTESASAPVAWTNDITTGHQPGLEPEPAVRVAALPTSPAEDAAIPRVLDEVRGSFTEEAYVLLSTSGMLGEFRVISEDACKVVLASFYNCGVTAVKMSVVWYSTFEIEVYVHDWQLPGDHDLWAMLPNIFTSACTVSQLLCLLSSYKVCMGNHDHDFVEIHAKKGMMDHVSCHKHQSPSYSMTLRHESCALLVKGSRCKQCQKTRSCLRSMRARRAVQLPCNKSKANALLSSSEKAEKLHELAKAKKSLQRKVNRLEEKIRQMKNTAKRLIEMEGEKMTSQDSCDMASMLQENRSEIESFPVDSFQRILFEQQMQFNQLKNKASMRWHPAVIRWCLYIKSKSTKAYDGLRSCLALPSKRTLYDYTHYTEAGTGFQVRVTEQLIEAAEREGLYDNSFKSYVGIIQDEVKIKEDLVYNKHTGELIGYIDLDRVSNELLNIGDAINQGQKQVAKYMLVIMVRGICSGLQYPLAAFATAGITADFLYPIIWEAITIVQLTVGLKVLFICCDGASPNRKFFTLHSAIRDKDTYFVKNPVTEENIYFISDVPHLLKTVRNCFSNSFAHKRSRQLWNEETISWQDVRQLFEDYCTGPYRLCSKLTPDHVYLTSFSVMKVNLAAQIMSSTVANALEEKSGPHVWATVKFIRMVNKWFDILNSRNLLEAQRKRNPDIAPISSVDDPRLNWLMEEFLPYFSEWEREVDTFYPHLPKSERAAKQLSHQTLTGLKLTTKSIVACTKFLLNQGAQFIMTDHFNQDPLERHFSHYRQKGGANENPSVFEVCHLINQVRAVSTQAVAPRHGNVRGNLLVQLDHAPLPRRKRPGNNLV